MQKRITRYFQKHPVVSSFFVVILFGSLQISFSYCSKVNCPAFTDSNFDDWFPYKTDQKIIFRNSLQEKDTITIGAVFRSPASSRSGSFSGGTACAAIVSIHSVESYNGQQNKFNITGDVYDYAKNFQLFLQNFYLYNMTTSDSGLVVNSADNPSNKDFTFEYLRNTNFSNKVYSKLEIITSDTNLVKSNRIYKIWLASKEGIIAYEEYPSRTRWIKQ